MTTMTAADRCDRCPAEARVRVTVKSGTLDFCSHCLHRHAAALAPRVISFECRNLAELRLGEEYITRLLTPRTPATAGA